MTDKEYFKKRMEISDTHYLMVSQWINYFNPDTVLDCGCGAGQFVKAFRDSDVDAYGFDISKFIVDKDVFGLGDNYWRQDIYNPKKINSADLVIAFDILEHLQETGIAEVLTSLKNWSNKYILISVPVLGDPNLERDPTHKIFKSRDWWIKQFEKVGKLIETPKWFYCDQQIYIIEVSK